MRIVRADLYKMAIPFNFVFTHAAARRDRSDNLILRLTLEGDVVGYGECLARRYVTGESSEEVFRWFDEIGAPLLARLDFPDKHSFIRFILDVTNGLTEGAKRCLLELALLDAFGRAFELTIAEIFHRPQRSRCVYAGVLGHTNGFLQQHLLRRMKDADLQHVKVKVGFGDADYTTLAACRAVLGDDTIIGLDANGAWSPDEAIERIADLSQFGVDFVEQPTARDDHKALAYVASTSPVDVVLDESVCTVADAETAAQHRLCHGISVRLSKVGGFAIALRIHDLARSRLLRYHVGALVGETGILAAAGRHLATMTEPKILEGSFGDLLLKEDVTVPSVRFGRGGRGDRIEGFGLGVTVQQERVDKHHVLHRKFMLSLK